ncbi:condensation domain-containing protein, partial [Streptomyces sp. NRRL S-37]|uniref:condensation domain-containing protein n=1 Tax=Streptomyces sp. NRRL S-37 TaxID=1463903 RepID=UPI001F255554
RDYCLAVEAAGEDEKARAYWLDRLDTLPAAPELPLLAPRQGEPTRFVRRTHTVSRERWTRLKERAQARGVTPSVLLCAAYAEALALWAKEPSFTLNVTIGDRLPLHPHVERLIGDFTNLVLLEVDRCRSSSRACSATRCRAAPTECSPDSAGCSTASPKRLRSTSTARSSRSPGS